MVEGDASRPDPEGGEGDDVRTQVLNPRMEMARGDTQDHKRGFGTLRERGEVDP